MEYMLTFHILNVYVDKTQQRQFKFTFKKPLKGFPVQSLKLDNPDYPILQQIRHYEAATDSFITRFAEKIF